MKILIVSMLFEPDHAGIAPIATDLAAGLAERGHEVVVHTTHPYYPEWRRKSSENPWRVSHEMIGQVEVSRFGLFVPRHPSRLIPRLLHELSFPLSLLRGLPGRDRFDIVIAFCPLLGTVLYSAARCLLKREKLWVNVQDIPADAAAATGIGRGGWLGRVAQWAQSRILGRADLCSSISPAMVDRVASFVKPGLPVTLFPNWLVSSLEDKMIPLGSKGDRPAANPPHLLYAGNIGGKQGLLDFCRYLGSARLDFRFRIQGDGAEAAAVREWVEHAEDQRFSFGGFLPEVEFLEALQAADLFVITERAGAGASFIPSKLIPALAVGTPLFCVCDSTGPLGTEVLRYGLGDVLGWAEMERLPLVLGQSTSNLVMRQIACRNRSYEYSRVAALDRAEALLDRMCSGSGQYSRRGEDGY